MSPKVISTSCKPILKICKIQKVRSIFDMKLNQNNVKYMFLISALINVIPLRFLTLDTLSLPLEVSEPNVDRF